MTKAGSGTTAPKRKRGAPKGNKNALRHGFYSKQFKANDLARLDKQDSGDVQAEIALLRINLDRLQEQMDFKEKRMTDNNGNQRRDDHYLRQLNTMALISESISTLVRTHYLTHGKAGDVTTSIMQALEEIRLEMGI